MTKALTLVRRILLGIVTLILIAVLLIPAIITTTSWDGTCYGFTDGSWPCPWTEFFSNQLGYMVMFTMMPLLCLVGLWLILTFIHFITKRNNDAN